MKKKWIYLGIIAVQSTVFNPCNAGVIGGGDGGGGGSFLGSPSKINYQAYVPAIAETLNAYTFKGVNEWGLQSLSFFSQPYPDFRLQIERFPELYTRRLTVHLVNELQSNSKYAGRSFSELSIQERRDVLIAAATEAEREANEKAFHELGYAHDQLGGAIEAASDDAVLSVEHSARNLFDQDAPYLSLDYRIKLDALLRRADEIHRTRDEIQREFNRALPEKISSKFFGPDNTYAKVDGKWVAADVSPFPEYNTLRAAFIARIKEVEKTPYGPWSDEILETMYQSLKSPKVREALKEELGSSQKDAEVPLDHSIILSSKKDPIKPLERLVLSAQSALHARKVEIGWDTNLLRARIAFDKYYETGKIPGYWRVKKIYAYYDSLVAPKSDGYGMYLRIKDRITRGDAKEGYPLWKDLESIRGVKYKQLDRATIISGIAAMAGFVSSFLLDILNLSLLSHIAIGVFILAFAGLFYFAHLKNSAGQLDYSEIRKFFNEIWS